MGKLWHIQKGKTIPPWERATITPDDMNFTNIMSSKRRNDKKTSYCMIPFLLITKRDKNKICVRSQDSGLPWGESSSYQKGVWGVSRGAGNVLLLDLGASYTVMSSLKIQPSEHLCTLYVRYTLKKKSKIYVYLFLKKLTKGQTEKPPLPSRCPDSLFKV